MHKKVLGDFAFLYSVNYQITSNHDTQCRLRAPEYMHHYSITAYNANHNIGVYTHFLLQILNFVNIALPENTCF